ncbi:MAG: elongation factor 4 [Parcubacteria group bacterium RIFCSPLOWO2_01_FULL_40_65]|nr:MAG: elongation factor 4 [Parcubacteria group bacterium RIFCSPHIGHO2_01_FULL_40_30]OHB19845.1 MAG: elongation factor 4 [Parcubacteria group bacterium RIFCSPHIGHO2_02_FULL_40_12]OHB21556.1 MAG: elongation factor 4 [Parcubacteria group bacterium RIFCSPLOWO2_01_FULL_40_65]OHB23518.1 MAG: elongation factor 4 [Parcubacteria group bacterium RIFCSPLOWO2_02_FULL_40_12]OHB24007.1 MAG: elongation factor 4 [Parcubacteria group bacterium RIFCSPLOWO2_12_FULL_40_10]
MNVRNFCIIAHIDSGKSTLADRFLELTGTIEKRKMQEQFLDMHPLERERGITIKLQPVRMKYKLGGQDYILNLIDTPGHVDFYYEVSRSLAAVEGAILLVDATKGIQAQTLSNYNFALKQNLKIIPVINKIDLPNAQIEKVEEEIINLTGAEKEEIFKISAKIGTGIEDILKAVIEKVPSPSQKGESLQALIFDSKFDIYKGIIAYVRIFNGKVKAGDKIKFAVQKAAAEVIEVGYFKPDLEKSESLNDGEIGYIATGLKDISQVRVGDTVVLAGVEAAALAGYEEPNPFVFASLYPRNADNFGYFKESLEKLKLQDSSLRFEPEHSDALGPGFRCGFLGMLHAEIVSERLKRDFGLDLIITSPSVEYKVRNREGREIIIRSASKLPDLSQIDIILEPMVEIEILAPSQYLGQIMKLMPDYRAQYLETNYLTSTAIILKYRVPLAEIIIDFYDKLKSVSSGFASMNYKFTDFQKSDLVKMDILIGGEAVEPFSRIVPRESSYQEGKRVVEKLKDIMPPQLFSLALQAAIGGKIIARETIKARRKDVTGYLYGGDVTRKKKLLEKQKRGKERLKETGSGRVEIPQEVYLEILKK